MRKLGREARGFTLVELLVATALALLLIGVAVALITSTLGSEPRTSSRSTQIEAGRVMLERITRQLRVGCKVEGVGTPIAGNGYRELAVYMEEACAGETPTTTYDCSADEECLSIDHASGKSELMVSGLQDDSEGAWPVFTINGDNYVEIQLRFPRSEAEGESVTLSDGVAMRNQQVETTE